MVLIGLLSVGVGLALDAYAERSNKNQADQEERQRLEGIRETGIVSSESSRKQQEEDAFKELQKYANFQNDLSARVMDEISAEEVNLDYLKFPHDNNNGNQNLILGSIWNRPFDPQPENRLPYPIFIPQNISEHGRPGWTRTYLPALMECGIEQQSFLRFIDSFNKSLEFSTWLETINIAALTDTYGRRESSADLASALIIASTVAKSRSKRDTFLEIANSTIFCNRGIFAMVLTYQPDDPSYTISINTSSAVANDRLNPQIGPSRPSSSRLKQMGTFVSKHTDLTPSFRREISAPSNIDPRLTNSSVVTSATPFSSLLSAVAKNRAHKRKQKSVTSRQSLRLKKIERGSGSILQSSSKIESSRAEEHFKLEPGAIYLVIMNDPDSQTVNDTWPTKGDQTAWDHGSATFGRSEKRTNDQMDITVEYPSVDMMGKEAAPPPAYTPRTEGKSYGNWMNEEY